MQPTPDPPRESGWHFALAGSEWSCVYCLWNERFQRLTIYCVGDNRAVPPETFRLWGGRVSMPEEEGENGHQP